MKHVLVSLTIKLALAAIATGHEPKTKRLLLSSIVMVTMRFSKGYVALAANTDWMRQNSIKREG